MLGVFVWIVVAGLATWLLLRFAQVVYLRAEIGALRVKLADLNEQRVMLDLECIKLSAQNVSLKLKHEDLVAQRVALFLDSADTQCIEDETRDRPKKVEWIH